MTANLSWTATLADPAIQADALSYCANGTLSQAAAIQILTDIANRGAVTAAELSSLQTIAAALNVDLTASPYVTSVFDQLVLGSPMNSTWTGGSATPVALGNLQVGTTPVQLNELIGKWFLGTDLPDPNIPQNLDGQGASAVYPNYKAIALPLFGLSGLPSVNDVNQGELGDCVVCATMIDMVVNHPNMLGSMIVNNGNGTYGVRFFIDGTADWVTVNNQMPVNSSANLVFNNAYAANDSFWADLIEKAYAELSASGQLGHPAVNSYDNINGNYASIVLPAFTGAAVTLYDSSSPTWTADKQIFIQDLGIGDDLLLDDAQPAGVNTTDSAGKTQLAGDHEFAVIGYDSATGNFIVRNPWGVNAPGYSQSYDTQFEVSMDQIAAVDGQICVDNSGNLPVGPYNVVGALAAKQAGLLIGAPAIADSAADVAGDLDQLQSLASAGQLGAITLIDGGQPTLTIGPAQLAADGQALTAIASSFSLAFSGALTVAEAQGLSSSALADLVSTFAVADSAANISTNLDTLEALASAGKLTSITLTNLDIPILTLTPAQLTNDSKALSEIAGAYLLNGSQLVLPQAGSANVAVVEINPDPALGPANVRFIDNHGGVVGFFGDSNLNYQAFIWSGENPGSVTDLSPLSGDVASVAKMDNGAGTVVGYSTSSADTSTPVVWQGRSGVAMALSLNSGFTSGEALAINSVGDIAGSESNGTNHSIVIWKNGVPTQVGANPYATADTTYAINDSDSLAGLATVVIPGLGSTTEAYTYQNGLLSVLPALAGDSSSGAYGINNANQVVGFSLGATEHAVVWQNGQVANLGTLALSDQSFSSAIDNNGIVVGYDFSTQSQQAVIWVDGVIYNLNSLIPSDSGWILQTARSVDDVIDGTVLVTGSGVLNNAADSYAVQIPVTNLSPTAAAAWQGYQTGLMTSAVHVTDSANDVSAQIDALQSLATAGMLTSITLTDSGTPTLSLTSTQIVEDAKAIQDISSSYTLSVAGLDSAIANFIVSQDAANRGANGIALDYPGIAPAGGNSVIGLQTTAFTGGYNVLVLDGPRSEYQLSVASSGAVTITDELSHTTVADTGISSIIFDGSQITPTSTGYPQMYFVEGSNGSQIAAFYDAVLGRLPDLAGLEYWQNQLNSGTSLVSIAADFIGSSEFLARFPSASLPADNGGPNNTAFVTALYENVLGRAPDTAGLAYWVGNLASGAQNRADVLLSFTGSAENMADISASNGGWLVNTSSGGYAAPPYTLVHDTQSSITEGGTETFTLATNGVAANTVVYYTLSGVTASEVVGGHLTGTITVGSNGEASLAVTLTSTPGQGLSGNLTATISTTSGGPAVATASEALTETAVSAGHIALVGVSAVPGHAEAMG